MWILAWSNCWVWHLESIAIGGDTRLIFQPSNYIYLAFEMLSRPEKDSRWDFWGNESRWWLSSLLALVEEVLSSRQLITSTAGQVEKEAPKACLVRQPARLLLFSGTFFFSCVVTRLRRTAKWSLFIFVLSCHLRCQAGPEGLIKWSE